MNDTLYEGLPESVESETATEPAAPSVGRKTIVRSDIEERKVRSFRAYLEVLDTAEWLRRQLINQLDAFDLTIDGFRLLEILYREGPITTEEFCKRRRCSRQAFDRLIKPLEERTWVKYEVFARDPVEWEGAHLAKELEGQPRRGRRMGRVSLTPDGEKFVHAIFPRHAKLVFAFMRALSMREQDTLIRVCRKLRDGDVVKLLDEMTMEE
ncbi:MAG: MarR family winged helix-turn-helix transcriptional regulator [Candidatus Acidiferrales bacterium]